jgi:hypothetical protein
MKSKKKGHEKAMTMKEVVITTILLIALICSASLSLAAPDLTIEPWDTVVGEEVTVEGTGFGANATVTISTTVTCYKPVVDNKCECTMNEFDIPETTDFKLSIREVTDNVTIYVKVLFTWLTINPDNPFGFIFDYDPLTNTSNVSRNGVFAGTYSIDVIGDAVDEGNCTMITSAVMRIQANETGGFTKVIKTEGIPICNFSINASSSTAGSAEVPLNLFLEGDASKDGRRNAYDCSCIARYWAVISGYDNSTICFEAADVDELNGVELLDAQLLAECLIGLRDWSDIDP